MRTLAPDTSIAALKGWMRPLVTLIACALAMALPLLVRESLGTSWDSFAFPIFMVTWFVAPIVAIWAFHGLLAAIAPRMLPLTWATYVPTLVLCAATALFGWRSGNGMILVFVYLSLLVWVPWSLIVVVQTPAQVMPRAIKLGLWIGTITIVANLCSTHRTEALAMATRYAHVIEQYKRTHGDYPPNLQAAGLIDPGRRVLDYYYSRGDERTPMLIVRDTFNPFDRWYYQFDDQKWEFHPD